MPHAIKGSPAAWLHWGLVLLISLMGLGLRLHNLSIESVYWDEFSSLIHLKPPAGYQQDPNYKYWDYHVVRSEAASLPAFWKANRELDPATMPLYYTFEYLVWNYGGQDVVRLRLLSVLFGVLAFPFVYLLGRALWGRSAGLVALFLFAASPVHVQFAQEIRMYSLFMLLAAISAYTFVRLVEQGGRWWWPHLAVNLLLLWTHPFAVWLPFVEGLFLCLFHWRRWRMVVAWGVANVLLLIPSAVYISTIEFYEEDSTSTWMGKPSPRLLIADLFADDFTGLTSQLWGRPDTFRRFFSEETALALDAAQVRYATWSAGLLVVLALLCIAWQAKRYMESRAEGNGKAGWTWALFLVMWAVLPPVILYVLSQVWRPMMMPRYTLHSSLALYLLAGGAVQAIHPRFLRAVPVAWLVLAYAYQQGLVFDGPHRTNWKAASAYLHQNAGQDDLVLVRNWLWRRVFTYSFGPAPQVIAYASDDATLAEQARVWLDSAYPKNASDTKPRGVWVVIQNGYFNPNSAVEFEAELVKRGMQWQVESFTGLEGLWVYRVADAPETPHAPHGAWQTPETYAKDFEDYSMSFWVHEEFANGACIAEEGLARAPRRARLWSYLAMNLKELQQFKAARAAFEKAISIDAADYPWSLTNLAECHLELGEPGRAVPLLRRALEQLPEDARPRWMLARAYIELGQPWEGVAIINERLADQQWEARHWEMLQLAQQRWGALRAAR